MWNWLKSLAAEEAEPETVKKPSKCNVGRVFIKVIEASGTEHEGQFTGHVHKFFEGRLVIRAWDKFENWRKKLGETGMGLIAGKWVLLHNIKSITTSEEENWVERC